MGHRPEPGPLWTLRKMLISTQGPPPFNHHRVDTISGATEQRSRVPPATSPRQKQEPPAKSARPEPAERQDAKQEAVKIKATNENTEEEASFPSFFIQDREVQESPAKKAVKKEEERHKGFEDAFEEEDEEESPIPPSLQSQAERELFFALQKNKRKPVSGGRS